MDRNFKEIADASLSAMECVGVKFQSREVCRGVSGGAHILEESVFVNSICPGSSREGRGDAGAACRIRTNDLRFTKLRTRNRVASSSFLSREHLQHERLKPHCLFD
jgi:hypothetical protein